MHRDLIVGMKLQKKDPRVSGYQKGQVLYKQPAEAPDERRFRIFRTPILQISGPISGRMPRYRVLMTRYRKPQYLMIGTHPDTRISCGMCRAATVTVTAPHIRVQPRRHAQARCRNMHLPFDNLSWSLSYSDIATPGGQDRKSVV